MENVGTSNIVYAYVIGSAFIDDVKVASVSQEAYGSNVQPGQKIPFYLVLTAQNIIDEELTDLTGVTDIDVGVGYVATNDLKVPIDFPVSSKKESGTSAYTVTGSVTINNDDLRHNNIEMDSFRVIVTFYNSKGTIVSLGRSNPLSAWSWCATESIIDIPFEVTPIDNHFKSDIAKYEIFIQYNMRQTNTNTPTQTPTPPSTAPTLPVATPTEIPETSNPTDNIWIIIVGLIIAVILIASSLLFTYRKNNKKATTNS